MRVLFKTSIGAGTRAPLDSAPTPASSQIPTPLRLQTDFSQTPQNLSRFAPSKAIHIQNRESLSLLSRIRRISTIRNPITRVSRLASRASPRGVPARGGYPLHSPLSCYSTHRSPSTHSILYSEGLPTHDPTSCPAPSITKYLVLGTWYLVLGTWYLVLVRSDGDGAGPWQHRPTCAHAPQRDTSSSLLSVPSPCPKKETEFKTQNSYVQPLGALGALVVQPIVHRPSPVVREAVENPIPSHPPVLYSLKHGMRGATPFRLDRYASGTDKELHHK
jgi:hypothetical protein